MTKRLLFLRLWQALLIAWTTVGGGVIVLNVWTHNLEFFKFLQIFYFYSTFVCVAAIVNSKRDTYISLAILLIGVGVQEALKYIVPSVDLFDFVVDIQASFPFARRDIQQTT